MNISLYGIALEEVKEKREKKLGTITVRTVLKLIITLEQLEKIYLPQNSPICKISQAKVGYPMVKRGKI